MTDCDQVHPRWGRPLEQYVRSWGPESFQKRANWDARTEAEIRNRARTAISMICDLSTPGADQAIDVFKNSITLSMLRSILDLTLSPETFSELGYPRLVDGCMRLMGTVIPSDQGTRIFKYEYGFLCFRIMTIALDVCCLQRAERFDAIIARMRAESETEMLLILSEESSRLALTMLSDNKGLGRCDWMLGTDTYKSPYPSQQMPFTVPEGPMYLMTMLISDERRFLKAFAATYPPGLSLVFCLIWRFVSLRARRLPEEARVVLVSVYCRVHFRYSLVAPVCDDPFLASICIPKAAWWKASTTPIDGEVGRETILAYMRRVTSTDAHRRISITRLPILLHSFLPRITDGAEHLLPRLYGSTIDRLWQARIKNEVPGDKFLEIVTDTINYLRRGLDCLHEKSYSNQSVMTELVDELIRHDAVDFIAQTAFSLPIDPNIQFVGSSSCLFESLGKVVPKEQLRSQFRDIVPDIWKYISYSIDAIYMDELILWEHFGHIGECMLKIGAATGFEEDLEAAREKWAFCNFERCPDPDYRVLSMWACSRCAAPYCSQRCQAGEWAHGSLRSFHKLTCGNILPQTDIPWNLVDQLESEFTSGPNRIDVGDFMYWGTK
ncbi:unnamed protein product [Rhizoctonia solani]|uniref:MYND-type domain-containing protein n=1 Tax=Rhizoctonia solani TaxID=456999 RepID=A0A8H3DUC4_9AGAM|nr:unnamed protein product [Rhizoctonia solani]